MRESLPPSTHIRSAIRIIIQCLMCIVPADLTLPQDAYVRESLGVPILPASQRPSAEEELAQVSRPGLPTAMTVIRGFNRHVYNGGSTAGVAAGEELALATRGGGKLAFMPATAFAQEPSRHAGLPKTPCESPAACCLAAAGGPRAGRRGGAGRVHAAAGPPRKQRQQRRRGSASAAAAAASAVRGRQTACLLSGCSVAIRHATALM